MQPQLSLSKKERQDLNFESKIKGWGADLKDTNRPGVPMDKNPMSGPELLYPSIPQQTSESVIFKSTEHRQMTPVFGSTRPPRFLSGLIRAKAYQFSEGQKVRWIMLIAADRIDMVEQLFVDLSKGHIPNLWKEMGLNAEWKYNRKSFQKKLAFTAIGLAGVVWFMRRKRHS